VRVARIEIVRTDAPQPWHARIRAANGQITWATENYTRRESADAAVGRLAEMFGGFVADGVAYTYVDDAGHISVRVQRAEIRFVDERGAR
jgi:uncharacterized protein YegP (UPF0339 family)